MVLCQFCPYFYRRKNLEEMRSLNDVTLIGRLGQDPQVRVLESGAKTASFSLATSRKWKDKDGRDNEETMWHTVVVWRGLADLAENYLKKGLRFVVKGMIKYRQYDKDGETRYVTEILGNSLVMIDWATAGQAVSGESSGS